MIIVIVLVVVIVVGVVGAIAAYSYINFATSNTSNLRLPRSVNLVNGQITVQPGQYNYYYFTIPTGATGITLTGSFTASGGGGNDIEVLVMDQTNFANWQNRNQFSSYYDSGQVTTGTVHASLPASGTYDLVYSNRFSTVSSKNVQTTVYLYYLA